MSQRKRIALLLGQPGEDYQKNFITGFMKQAFLYNYDVCVFTMYHKIQESKPREVGESNIFNLIQYDSFDAVVIMGDTIQTPGVLYNIEKKLKETYKGVVLCVDKASVNFPAIKMDHRTPIIQLVSHLIEKHGITDIAFLTGTKWHAHSAERLQAYMDCMKEYGLEVQENYVLYGDYWYDSGVKAVERLLQMNGKLPRAIACANDYMAIGVADGLTRKGYRVPEDVAVTGYGCTEEGRTSPQPITSVYMPAEAFGVYGADCVYALLNNSNMPVFKPEYEFFTGSSCGCHNESVIPVAPVRAVWPIYATKGILHTNVDYLLEDMLSRNNFRGLMDTIQTYTYQIREFDSFHICLNASWDNTKKDDSNLIRSGYADEIIPVLKCGPSGKGEDQLNFTEKFPVGEMLPHMNKDRDIPKAYIFSPLHFEDVCFGYAVISYGNEAKFYGENYYMWLRNVMLGLEYYRRIAALRAQNQIIEEQKIMDSLTGLFDYNGFVKHAKPMIERVKSTNQYVGVLAIDVCEIGDINSKKGREAGDKVLVELARMLKESAGEGAMCCRLGNDEFVVAQISPDDSADMTRRISERLLEALFTYNARPDAVAHIEINAGTKTGRVVSWPDLENIMNIAVSRKNGNKAKALQVRIGKKLSEEELQEAKVVGAILDNNLFTYHFQPIVRAKDGSIYAYEALMRTNVEPRVSPLQVIKYAEHLGRLYDVEKATFFNVMSCIEDNKELFDGKKVFINSIPGKQLEGEDANHLAVKLRKFSSSVVVELTEQTEADDEALERMKDGFRSMGVETAVDDYGTGYSNIINLLRYAPNYVKIDRMLLTGIQDNLQKQHFVKSIIGFAHENNFKALAEGVETTQELETVISLGVDLIQGYYTARPGAEIVQEISEEIREEICKYSAKSEI
ncbi:MAG: EAL domain-containing protein [Lachnospiraceae bacterium]|nr:EAL domain-containing protein [Lachnospiraceae bacterium]